MLAMKGEYNRWGRLGGVEDSTSSISPGGVLGRPVTALFATARLATTIWCLSYSVRKHVSYDW